MGQIPARMAKFLTISHAFPWSKIFPQKTEFLGNEIPQFPIFPGMPEEADLTGSMVIAISSTLQLGFVILVFDLARCMILSSPFLVPCKSTVQCNYARLLNGTLTLPGCEFDCIAEQNAPHFRHFATQISACMAVFTMENHIPTSALWWMNRKLLFKIFKWIRTLNPTILNDHTRSYLVIGCVDYINLG